MPKRIQRKRTKGWKMPEEAVYVGRPTKWGNPFKVGDYAMRGDGCGGFPAGIKMLYTITSESYADERYTKIDSVDQAIAWFRWYFENHHAKEVRRELRGKDLACWCPLNQPCHADVLLEIANAAPLS